MIDVLVAFGFGAITGATVLTCWALCAAEKNNREGDEN